MPDRVSVGALTRAFPPELVDRIVDTTDTRELRRRLLPARLVVYVRHEAPRCIPGCSREELGGRFLGLMAYLDPKGEGDNSMPGKQRSCSGV